MCSKQQYNELANKICSKTSQRTNIWTIDNLPVASKIITRSMTRHEFYSMLERQLVSNICRGSLSFVKDIISMFPKFGDYIGINIKNQQRYVSLACHYGHLEIVKYLIEQGMIFNLDRLMDIVIQQNHLSIVKYLIQYQKNMGIYMIDNRFIVSSICHGQLESVKYFIQQGSKIPNNLKIDNPTIAVYLSEIHNVNIECNMETWNILMRAFHTKKSKKKNIKNDPLFDPSIGFIVSSFVW